MQSNIKILVLFLVLTTSCMILPRQTEAQPINVNFQVFYDQLSPYGQWVDYNSYGYVWIPDSGEDFVPYSTDGHWVLTDNGWTWASDYIWGWATFHYGRWSYANTFGWFWVPDTEWGPAWVNWRQADGYYGWCPMEPGITVSMSFDRSYNNMNDHWLFVRDRDFERTDIHNYYAGRNDWDRIIRNSTVINRTYVDKRRQTTYVVGPSRESVQRATGRTIKPLRIQENNRPGQEINNGQLRIYRPRVEKNTREQKNIPTRVTEMKDVKHNMERNSNNQNKIGTPDNKPAVQPSNRFNNDNNSPRQQNINQPDRKNNVPVDVENNQSAKPVKPTPADNTKPDRQPEVVAPQNNNVQPTQSRPVQQRDVNPQNNNQPQQRDVNQPNNNQPQQRDVNQPNNNKPEQQNTPPANVQNKQQRVQNQNINQGRNNKPARQQRSVKQEIKKEQAKIPDAVPADRR